MVGRPIIDPIDGRFRISRGREEPRVSVREHLKPSKPQYLDPVSRGFQEGGAAHQLSGRVFTSSSSPAPC